ncbi:hypothetical protein [Saccharicrinis aurantiacus]|uniref:hypothetical protein n=1 Tax=Saccharicrinis aurantiacus TaxID=1849719 RepID=UPI0024916DDE|nr:hypothetical protein [Saccharicrinis aurantiacus]
MTTKIAALALSMWALTIIANAQTKVSKYNGPLNEKNYSINILKRSSEERSLCISLPSKDIHKKNGGIIVEVKNLEQFRSALNKAKNQYVKLNNTYNQKQIKTLEKDLKIKCKVKGYFMYGSLWQFQSKLNPNFHYSFKQTDESIESTLIMNTGVLSSSDNWFVRSEGYNISFNSPEELDNFIALFSNDEINKLLQES